MHFLRVRVHVFFGACVVFALRVVAALAVHVCVVRLRVHCCMCGRVFWGGRRSFRLLQLPGTASQDRRASQLETNSPSRPKKRPTAPVDQKREQQPSLWVETLRGEDQETKNQ